MRTKYVAWVICAAGFAAFAVMAWQVKTNASGLMRLDETVAFEARAPCRGASPPIGLRQDCHLRGRDESHAGPGHFGHAAVLRRSPRLAVIWLLAALLGEAINEGAKALIDRQRPDATLRTQSVHETSASFPSGHAMGSIIGYGALIYVVWVVLRRRSMKLALTAAFVALVMVIGWTRVYLRAHWCSDVLAGWALGIGWLALCHCPG